MRISDLTACASRMPKFANYAPKESGFSQQLASLFRADPKTPIGPLWCGMPTLKLLASVAGLAPLEFVERMDAEDRITLMAGGYYEIRPPKI